MVKAGRLQRCSAQASKCVHDLPRRPQSPRVYQLVLAPPPPELPPPQLPDEEALDERDDDEPNELDELDDSDEADSVRAMT